jgi:diguanylate cyclase (GGDEF)-like protein
MSATPRHHVASLEPHVLRDIDFGRSAVEIARLQGELEAQARLIRQQTASLAHSRKIFERASAAARIGVWECSLPDETLTWTDQVYEIFELPRDLTPVREQILKFYSPESLQTLEAARSKAIAERSGFILDAEITTAKGRRRWIRLTATVECENGAAVRIFGMKQDITEEKTLYERMRYLADFDVLTGVANRSSFQARLCGLEERQAEGAPLSALLLIDLDGFKQINDTFGHALGDEYLRSVAQRLTDVCHEPNFVARIGGDEFAVLLGPDLTQDEIEEIAGHIVEALREPMEGCDWPFKVGASVGIARVDTSNPVELFKKADAALYAAKAAGRNTFRMFSSLGSENARMTLPHGVVPNNRMDRLAFGLARFS